MKIIISTLLISFLGASICAGAQTPSSPPRLTLVVPPEPVLYKYEDIPSPDFVEGIKPHPVFGESVMVSQNDFSKGVISVRHNHPEEEILVVIEGKMRAIFDDRSFMLETGDVIVIPSYTPHQLEALEDSRTVEAFGPGRVFRP